MEELVILISIIVAVVFSFIIVLLSRYKRCPSDKILVVYGKIGKQRDGSGRSAKCIHGGAAFIVPVFQSCEFLDLTPMSIEVNLKKALSKQNIRVDVPARFTVGISTDQNVMTNAAERLLGLTLKDIQEMAKDIIIGQMRLIVATMDIEEINTDRDKFLDAVSNNVESELKKIGLKLINVNVTDIEDESGYIIALGREAAAKAINDAKKVVAEKERDGEVGQAEAEKERDIKIAEAKKEREIGKANATRDEEIGKADAEKTRRIKMAEANAKAIEGENLSKIEIANSEATRREKEAEAKKIAISAEKVQTAKALEESYVAEKEAEIIRAEREKATQRADIIVAAEIEKEKVEIEAEAEAEKRRRHAKGDADAVFYKMEAEARGTFEMLSKQAEGFERLVKAGGADPKNAVLLMIADKLPELVKTQVDAIKNIKIDKVTVWDSNNGGEGSDGKTSTANFLSGIAKSIPPLDDLFNMAGMELPNYLGSKKSEDGSDNNNPLAEAAKKLKGKSELFKESNLKSEDNSTKK